MSISKYLNESIELGKIKTTSVNERLYLDVLGNDVKKIFKKLPKDYHELPQFGKRVWNKIIKANKSGISKNFIIKAGSAYVVTSDIDGMGKLMVNDLDLEYADIWIVEMSPINNVFFSISFLESFGEEWSDKDRTDDGRLTNEYFNRFKVSLQSVLDGYYYDHIYTYLNYEDFSIVVFKQKDRYSVVNTNTGEVYMNRKLDKKLTSNSPLKMIQALYNHFKK